MRKKLTKLESVLSKFNRTGRTKSEWIELDNLDRAWLVKTKDKEVMMENWHGTQFPVSDLSDSELDVFLYLFTH